jgi:type I pantothenate kinase
VRQPDVLIFEGLNVLQAGDTVSAIVSDFFDFSVFLDANETDIEEWYVERFLILQRTAFQDPSSYFRHYRDLPLAQAREVARDLSTTIQAAAHLPLAQAREVARRIWREINLVNLRENILPTRTRADLASAAQAL